MNETPSSIENEQALLGALLSRNDVLFTLPADFNQDHFYEPLHQRIFAAINEAVARGDTADVLTLRGKFDGDPALADIGGGKYLMGLMRSAMLVMDAPMVAKNLIDLAQRRQIISACQSAMMRASDFTVDLTSGEIAAQLSGELESSVVESRRYRVSTERQVTERLVERLKTQRAAATASTGIGNLDVAMDGGMYAGKLYGIVGRKKMGKTMLAGTVSTNLQMAGTKHLYLALEMGSDEIHQRNMARMMNCYESAFRTGYAESPQILNRLADYAVTAKNYRMYLDAPGLSFDDLRHILPLYIRRYKITGFILDCWQLVGGKKKSQSTAEHLDEVAQWLAETVKRYGVWGLVTAQENQEENTRGGEGIRLACDQLYRICKRDETSTEAWLEMMETRYTKWQNVGSENFPSLRLSDKFTHYEQCAV